MFARTRGGGWQFNHVNPDGDSFHTETGRTSVPNVRVETADGTRVTSWDSASEPYDRTTTLTNAYGDRASVSAAGPELVRAELDIEPHLLSVEHEYDHERFSYTNRDEGYEGSYDTLTGTGRVTAGGHEITANPDQLSYDDRRNGLFADYGRERVTVANEEGGFSFDRRTGSTTARIGTDNYGTYDPGTGDVTAHIDGGHRLAANVHDNQFVYTKGEYGVSYDGANVTLRNGGQHSTYSPGELAVEGAALVAQRLFSNSRGRRRH
ncbi:hypothetical protein ccbrp13_48760 [Ktedonobacteria bacterium brp13]|nr:hypothetical protein ccbrp13_48760 [Ktedonobacteria bacterium brp13]